MTVGPRQLTLDLPFRPAIGFEDFLVSPSNGAAVALVDRWPDWPMGAAILVGPAGSGKSHLADVWRLKSSAAVLASADLTRAVVPDLAAAGACVIEDVHAGLNDEQALFHLLNLVRELKIAVLLTSRTAPGDLSVTLPDLRSRLRALPVGAIEPPDDALLGGLLVKLFADRHLGVDPGIVAYLLNRMERSAESARRLVAEIDRLALARQQRITRNVASAALDAVEAPT